MLIMRPDKVSCWLVMVISGFAMATCESSMGSFVALEVNCLSSIGLLKGGSSKGAAECYLWYQACGSLFLFTGCVLGRFGLFFWGSSTFWVIMALYLFGLLIKLGMFPFQFWVFKALEGNCWSLILALGVVQKYGQFIMVSGFGFSGFLLYAFCVSGCLTSGAALLVGFESVSIKKLMTCSVVFQTGVLSLLCLISSLSFSMYYLQYLVSSLSFLVGMLLFSEELGRFPFRMLGMSCNSSLVFGFYALSLIGFPPTSGFLMKVFLFESLVKGGMHPLLVVMAVLSVFSSGWYFRIFKGLGLKFVGGKSPMGKYSVGLIQEQHLSYELLVFYCALLSFDVILSGSMGLLFFFC